MRVGANSGQTFRKWSKISLRFWNHNRQKIVRLENWNSNIFFQLHLLVPIFLFISCLKTWSWEKYQHMLSGCKKFHKPGHRFSEFSQTFIELSVLKAELAPPHRNFSNGYANLKIVSLQLLWKQLSLRSFSNSF